MEFLGKKRTFPLTASILLGGFVFLYLSLFYLPATPIHFNGGDATTYLFNATRMLHGKVIYRDFFEFTPPATEVFYFLVFKIFGVHAWIPNAVLVVLGLSIAWLMIVISKSVIPGKAAYLPAALFLVIPFRSQLDPTHHWFSTLAVMAAIALLVENITALRLVGAGALCGVATCFTQSTGLPAVIGLGLFLLWAAVARQLSWINFRRAQLYVWSSFSIVIVLFNAYFVFAAGPGTFFRDTILFGIRYWHTLIWNTLGVYMTDMPLPYFHPWYRVVALAVWASVYLLTPLIYILFFVRYWDESAERPSEPWDRLVLIAITGMMLFLGVAAAPSWLRLCVIAPPGLILFGWFFSTSGRSFTLRTAAAWVVVIGLALGACGERALGWRKHITLPIGSLVVLNPNQYEEIKFLLDHTKPGEYFFGNDEFNYLLDLRDPSPVPYVTPSDYTRPEQVRATLQGLKSHPVKYVFWSVRLDMPPAVAYTTNHLAPLRDYLHSHYRLVKNFVGGEYSIWEKRTVAPPAFTPPAPDGGSPLDRPSQSSSAPQFPLKSWVRFFSLAVSPEPLPSADSYRLIPGKRAAQAALRPHRYLQSTRQGWHSVRSTLS